MSQQILINITANETRVATLANNKLNQIQVERDFKRNLIGNIYKGKITRILPGLDAAFVDIGLDRNAFLHIRDVDQTGNADKIENLLSPGQEIIVQVYKESLGSKGPRVSTFINIPARYLVFTPKQTSHAISQKIINENERQRLLQILEEQNSGFCIIRTLAEGVDREDILDELTFLNKLWDNIQARIGQSKSGELIYQDLPLYLKVMRDSANPDIQKIWIDDDIIYNEMMEFANRYVTTLMDKIELYSGSELLFDNYQIEFQIQQALNQRIALPCGGYIAIDQTEALTTIDVNSGSCVGTVNFNENIFKINIEAVGVIAEQIKLRNIGGIIIIDFIDMLDDGHKIALLEDLRHAFSTDYAKTEICELTRLGLVQMTRKRSRESLENILCTPCLHCQGKGKVKSLATVCYEILRNLQKSLPLYKQAQLKIIAQSEVIQTLNTYFSDTVTKLAKKHGKNIQFEIDSNYYRDKFHFSPQE